MSGAGNEEEYGPGQATTIMTQRSRDREGNEEKYGLCWETRMLVWWGH